MKNYNHCAAYDDSSTVWSKGVLYCVLLLDYRQQQLRTLEGMRPEPYIYGSVCVFRVSPSFSWFCELPMRSESPSGVCLFVKRIA